MDEIECKFKIEVYKSLREEALAKMERQYRVIGLGAGGIGVLLGIAFQFQVYPLFLIIPLLIILSMAMYDAERGAILNIGKYMGALERELISKNNLNGWDNWLVQMSGDDKSKKRKTYINFDYAAFSFLLALLMGCVIGIISFQGNIKGFEEFTNLYIRYAFALIYVAVGLYFWYLYCKRSR